MARVVKSQRPSLSLPLPDLISQVPPRETCDKLLHLYFRNFESTYRVLHRGAFFQDYEEYWLNPSAASSIFIMQLLLVVAIGTVFYDEEGCLLNKQPSGSTSFKRIWIFAPTEHQYSLFLTSKLKYSFYSRDKRIKSTLLSSGSQPAQPSVQR